MASGSHGRRGAWTACVAVFLCWMLGCAHSNEATSHGASSAVSSAPSPLVPSPAPASALVDRPRYRLPTAQERKLIDELILETERVRGLRFKEPVEVRIQDRAAMRAYVSGAMQQDDLQRVRRRYVALGLLEPHLDVRELLEALMEEELVGYYDPELRILAIRDDVARTLGRRAQGSDLEWRATVVHELVHALQDQHLGLGAAMKLTRTIDADNAFGALVEGDATLAMLGYAAGQVGVPLEELARDRRQLEASLGATSEQASGPLRAAPAIVREPLLFRYRAGALFVAHLFLRGGWEAVDQAHRSPPGDTLTIIEPAQYASPSAAREFSLLPLDWLVSRGFSIVDKDALGAFEMAVALEAPPAQAALISRSWRGDQFVVVETVDGDASVWGAKFASIRASREAERLLRNMPNAAGPARSVMRFGLWVVVVRNLPAAEVETLFERYRVWKRANRD